ncbi:MAG: DUF1569 domain-containing protein [Melioribacteraceae bacterium]|nr:DUF1569 domain-containing protein [Melioribacteraceae bacterium]
MKNILNKKDQELIFDRLNKLSKDQKAHWGKMNVQEAVCHMADQIRLGVGEIKTADEKVLPAIVKHLVLLGVPAPKGKVETFPELKQGVKGTKPTGLNEDIKTLISLIENFDSSFGNAASRKHAAFGDLSKSQWGRLCYIHLDHHLKQFGG